MSQAERSCALADPEAYNAYLEELRPVEFPTLQDTIYLDHAGTTLYPRSLIDSVHQDLTASLLGNPHSGSSSSVLTSSRIDNVRLQILRLFGADPRDFDVVFVANATAGIKLVAEAFAAHPNGFSYIYHQDSHTSLLGARNLAARTHRRACKLSAGELRQGSDDEQVSCSVCAGDDDIEKWLNGASKFDTEFGSRPTLFAYPAQSNMDGRRLPLSWCQRLRERSRDHHRYSLLDAASFVSTTPLDLSDTEAAPDFTVLSFYKVFGFPDLGALIVRKASGNVLRHRRYFGGGTVDMAASVDEQWHKLKEGALHECLEDGTLPFHSIIALESAIATHLYLFGGLARVSEHTSYLANELYQKLLQLRHGNGQSVIQFYGRELNKAQLESTRKVTNAIRNDDVELDLGRTTTRVQNESSFGPILAFNIRGEDGSWASHDELQKLASVHNIELRTGSLCNPGGMQEHLKLSSADLCRNYQAGLRCGQGSLFTHDGPLGMIRISLGASSTMRDVDAFVSFLAEFYVQSASSQKETLPFITAHPAKNPHDASLTLPLSMHSSSDRVNESKRLSSSTVGTAEPAPSGRPGRYEAPADPPPHFEHEETDSADQLKQVPARTATSASTTFTVQNLTVYPIKSCGGWSVPASMSWPIREEGFIWDREWCLIHQGSRAALSQKRFPRMVLFKPSFDFKARVLRVQWSDPSPAEMHSNDKDQSSTSDAIDIPLDMRPDLFDTDIAHASRTACLTRLCGDDISPLVYKSAHIADFFTRHLRIPVFLARLPLPTHSFLLSASATSHGPQTPEKALSQYRQTRLRLPHAQVSDTLSTQPPHPRHTYGSITTNAASNSRHRFAPILGDDSPPDIFPIPGSYPSRPPSPPPSPPLQRLLLANESPILITSQASIDQLNRDIDNHRSQSSKSDKSHAPAALTNAAQTSATAVACESRPVTATSFRANIVLKQPLNTSTQSCRAYAEDHWTRIRIQHAPLPPDRAHESMPVSALGRMLDFFQFRDIDHDQSIGLSSVSDFAVDSAGSADSTIESLSSPDTTVDFDLDILGPCRRCPMVCIDQQTAARSREPFTTLAKTRKRNGGVWFGVHAGLPVGRPTSWIRVGDQVSTFTAQV